MPCVLIGFSSLPDRRDKHFIVIDTMMRKRGSEGDEDLEREPLNNREDKDKNGASSRFLFANRNKVLSLCFALSAVLYLAQYSIRHPTGDGSSKSGSSLNSSPSGSLRTRFDENVMQCEFFLAESAIPMGGLGIYTTKDIKKGQMTQPTQDICVYVADTPDDTPFDTHSWARDVFFGNFEGLNPRAACEGVATLVNNMPERKRGGATSVLKLTQGHTNAGLKRNSNPGAGASSHYYGMTSKAIRNVKAGSELTIEYGDWPQDDDSMGKIPPMRSTDWIRTHGKCVDNIVVQPATNSEMGRGAFAKRKMKKGTIVSAAPIQVFEDRHDFAKRNPEALFVNYCFQPDGMNMLLYPYAPGVNLINHSRKPNVAVRWSNWAMSHSHWLDLPLERFHEMAYPGAMVIEYVALREIKEGEEIFLDYGDDWQKAWDSHVEHWKPTRNAEKHVYPEEMPTDDQLKTLEEQEDDPYPKNLAMVCDIGDWDRKRGTGKPQKWYPSDWEWPMPLTYCHILSRKKNKEGEDLYEIAITFDQMNPAFDSSIPREEMYIDYDVPRKAIFWVEKPYQSDMHLKNAFRHTMKFPDELVPQTWRQQRSSNSSSDE